MRKSFYTRGLSLAFDFSSGGRLSGVLKLPNADILDFEGIHTRCNGLIEMCFNVELPVPLQPSVNIMFTGSMTDECIQQELYLTWVQTSDSDGVVQTGVAYLGTDHELATGPDDSRNVLPWPGVMIICAQNN